MDLTVGELAPIGSADRHDEGHHYRLLLIGSNRHLLLRRKFNDHCSCFDFVLADEF